MVLSRNSLNFHKLLRTGARGLQAKNQEKKSGTTREDMIYFLHNFDIYRWNCVLSIICFSAVPHLTVKQNNVFTQGAVGVLCQPPDFAKEAGTMVTYSDLFTFVIMLCAVITLVITFYRHKK